MFSHSSAFIFIAATLASTAFAMPQGTGSGVSSDQQKWTDIKSSQCSNNDVKCCDNDQTVGGGKATSTAGLLSLLVPLGLDAELDCDTIDVIGLLNPGAACNSQPVCCTGVNQNGLVNLGCNPIVIQA